MIPTTCHHVSNHAVHCQAERALQGAALAQSKDLYHLLQCSFSERRS